MRNPDEEASTHLWSVFVMALCKLQYVQKNTITSGKHLAVLVVLQCICWKSILQDWTLASNDCCCRLSDKWHWLQIITFCVKDGTVMMQSFS